MRREKSLCPVCIPASKGPTFKPPPPHPRLSSRTLNVLTATAPVKRNVEFLVCFCQKWWNKRVTYMNEIRIAARSLQSAGAPAGGPPCQRLKPWILTFAGFPLRSQPWRCLLEALLFFFASLCSPTHSLLTFSSSVIIISPFFGIIRKWSYRCECLKCMLGVQNLTAANGTF